MMKELEVLYEDNHVIVVVKPKNVLSQSDRTGDVDLLSMVKEYIKEKYHKPGNVYVGLVHRLDRPVSGVMVFAKTSKAASRLSDQVRTKKMEKKYVAVVHGLIAQEQGTLIDYIAKQKDFSSKVTDSEKGQYAELSYRVIDKNIDKNLTLLDILLNTGRHHQIRVQFASRGYPLYGDLRYGKGNEGTLCLHAYSLSFYHPITKEKMTFVAFPPKMSAFSYFDIPKVLSSPQKLS